jgi:hypothetical protein
MSRLLTWTLILVILGTLMLVGVRAVGAQRWPLAFAMLDPEACEQPCWRGIRPGKTTLDEAEQLLRAGRDARIQRKPGSLEWTTATTPPWQGSAFRWSTFSIGSINYITLLPPPGTLQLGDAITIFGDPIVANLCWRTGNAAPLKLPYLGARVHFRGNVAVLAYNPDNPTELRYDPKMVVLSLMYSYPAAEPPYAFDTPSWRGFARTRAEQVC